MADAISVKPMVDILTDLTGKTVVMSGEVFVYLEDSGTVESTFLTQGLAKQEELLLVATKKAFTDEIQKHLDTKAKEKGYDNIVSACSYAGYVNPFQTEAVAYGTWRAEVWAYAYAQLALIESGSRPMSSLEAFLAELPQLSV